MRSLLTSMILFTCSILINAQDISGKLIDKTGKGIEYATITLMSAADSSLVKGAISEEDGSFIFENTAPGKYYYEANYIGYSAYLSPAFDVADKNISFPPGNMTHMIET